MNAELTMMEAAAQKSDTANPATGQLISGTLRLPERSLTLPRFPLTSGHDPGHNVRHDWSVLGRLLAPVRWPRYVLDPSPHGDPALWSVGRTHVRVPDTFDDLWTQPDSAQRKASSVRIWAFRPLGAFIAAWGAFAMIISAPSTTGGITLTVSMSPSSVHLTYC